MPTGLLSADKKILQLLHDISAHIYDDEAELATVFCDALTFVSAEHEAISTRARHYISAIRKDNNYSLIEEFFRDYGLNSKEGRALMQVAEALLRIPDSKTANALLSSNIIGVEWEKFVSKDASTLFSSAIKGLQMASTLFSQKSVLVGVVDPVVRKTMEQAMRVIGKHFILGETVEGAIKRSNGYEKQGYRFSYDMLGEAARDAQQAKRFFSYYMKAVAALSEHADNYDHAHERPSISVKLSALHPRYELRQEERVFKEMVPKLMEIVLAAKSAGIMVTIDAEELYRLDISLRVFEHVFTDDVLKGYDGFGLAVQAYQKSAYPVVDFVIELAKRCNRSIPVRLVKGAYWDSEIRHAQLLGLENYPVFTRKCHTDISYLACANKLLDAAGFIYPQFATHNAYTVAAIEQIAGDAIFEFQRLHGMGEPLYRYVIDRHPCRVYAPVGKYAELLPYLIRRMLENGANTSFVKHMADPELDDSVVVDNPCFMAKETEFASHPDIPLPRDLYGSVRQNSKGRCFGNIAHLYALREGLKPYLKAVWRGCSVVNGDAISGVERKIRCPGDSSVVLGKVYNIDKSSLFHVVDNAVEGAESWSQTDVELRAKVLNAVADLFEEHEYELISLCMREGGKTAFDAQDELREAIDFCRYYAFLACELFFKEERFAGPTGENNYMQFTPKGVFVCVSPWNFPLAIFTGQIAAALAAGNAVIAKPAQQVSLIAHRVVQLMHEAGVPKEVLHLLIGSGSMIGNVLLTDERISGVAFTGSNETANQINAILSRRKGSLATLIAETGGQNCMIVDSSALLERVVDDVIASAFNSAGQRCSALRVLYVQDEIYDSLIELLKGAIAELTVGNPESDLLVDVGPVIDISQRKSLEKHIKNMHRQCGFVAAAKLDNVQKNSGYFVAPHIFEIPDISVLEREVFGPVLHVVRYKSGDLERVVDAINSTGYGLTFGIYSRIQARIDYVNKHVKAGNHYVNRNMVGAVVGVQPFGGEGLSGTGFKAGGPHYLLRFVNERVISDNTSAIGGDLELLS